LESRGELEWNPCVLGGSAEGESDVKVRSLEEPVRTIEECDKTFLERVIRWVECRSKIVEDRLAKVLD
jgi:hypothetical protein